MLGAKTLSLDHPKVQLSKQSFEKRASARKCTLTFEQLFEYFKSNSARFEAIAKEAGISPQRVQEIYEKYFINLIECTGLERRKLSASENWLVRAKQDEQTLFASPHLRPILESAVAAGCKVEGVAVKYPSTNHGMLHSTRLSINGHVCSVHVIKRPWAPPSIGLVRPVARASIQASTLKKTDACIVYSAVDWHPKRIFIVPTAPLRVLCANKTALHLLVPLEKRPDYSHSMSQLNLWKYEDAWFLLSHKDTPPAS